MRESLFAVGQRVQHRLFHYRGLIVDVDPVFNLSEEWYEQVARSRPPKDRPWYRVLVHGDAGETYVAERNLEPDPSLDPIDHPAIPNYFDLYENGRYVRKHSLN